MSLRAMTLFGGMLTAGGVTASVAALRWSDLPATAYDVAVVAGGLVVLVVLASDRCSNNLERILAVILGRSLNTLVPTRPTRPSRRPTSSDCTDDVVRPATSPLGRRRTLRRPGRGFGRPSAAGRLPRRSPPASSTELVKDAAEQRTEPGNGRESSSDHVITGEGHR